MNKANILLQNGGILENAWLPKAAIKSVCSGVISRGGAAGNYKAICDEFRQRLMKKIRDDVIQICLPCSYIIVVVMCTGAALTLGSLDNRTIYSILQIDKKIPKENVRRILLNKVVGNISVKGKQI